MIRRVPHCAHWGAHTLLVEGDSIVGVEPFKYDPVPSKMIHATRYWLDPEHRIDQPYVRAGWLESREKSDRTGRGSEEFVPVSWDVALELVSNELSRVKNAHGVDSIFGGSYGWASSGRFHHAPTQLHRLLNAHGGYTEHRDTYSLAAGPVIIRHVLGDESAVYGGSNSIENFTENSELLLVFGALSPRTAQICSGGIDAHHLDGYLRRIVERKVRVILVSPSRADLPEYVPAEWWPIRPGSDTALLLALTQELVNSGLESKSFMERYCSGTAEFLAYLSGKTDGVEKTAAWAAELTDLSALKIKELAHSMARKRSMITMSWSLQRAEYGEQPYWAGLGLAAAVGQIGLPGGGIGYGYASTGGLGTSIQLSRSVAISQLESRENNFIPAARIADALLTPGGSYHYDGQVRAYPDIRLVYWAGGNPFHHHQDLNRLENAWQCPETIIVQEPVWTATAQRADIVLPASSTLERNDIASTSRMRYVFAMHKAVEPVGQSRSDYDIFSQIAERLGVYSVFTEGNSEMQWLRQLYEQVRSDTLSDLNYPMPPFDDFWAMGYTAVPVSTDRTFLSDFRSNPELHPLKTATGRIILSSEVLGRLQYQDCPAHPTWIVPSEWLGSDLAKTGALHMLSQQPMTRLHSQLDFAPVSQSSKNDGREWMMLSATDALDRGIEDGATVLASNTRGKCLATAKISPDLRPGVCILPTGAWFRPGTVDGLVGEVDLAGNPNVLTLDKPASQFSQGCAAQTCLVFVELLKKG